MEFEWGTVIACITTILGSIGGSWVAMNNRLYTVEKNIELIKLDIENYKKGNDRRADDMEGNIEKISSMFERVMQSVSEINNKLKFKQDRKFADDK